MDTRTATKTLNEDPLAKELLNSAIPARLGYVSEDGSPRVVPVAFFWTGEHITIGTDPSTPKASAIAKSPMVALTIDTNSQPPHVLLIRGSARVDIVPGVFPEYLEGARKIVPKEQWSDFEATVHATYKQMARIAITPQWVKLMDFEIRVPDFLARLGNQ
jgi:hypothetical protein